MEKNNSITVYIELLEEGSSAWRPTQARAIGNSLYTLLPTPDYDPEDESWAFLPGDTVRLKEKTFSDGTSAVVACHPTSGAVSVAVELENHNSFELTYTHALPLGNGLFEILATPAYDEQKEKWKFPPGSVVRIEKKTFADNFSYFVAVNE